METLTQEQHRQHYAAASNCHICNKPFKPTEKRIFDHCHITSKYRGPAHNKCNLDYGIVAKQWKLPVVFHNLKGYDSHLIIKSLKKDHGPMTAIPLNMERYLTFTVGQLRFIDSMQFMPTSLEKLAETLADDEFLYTKEGFPIPEEFELVQQKGVYHYDYFDSFEKFHETELPPKETFFNQLYDKELDDESYRHAQNVWNTFQCEDLTAYHDIYLKCDVLLPADIFEKFHNTYMDHCTLFHRFWSGLG